MRISKILVLIFVLMFSGCNTPTTADERVQTQEAIVIKKGYEGTWPFTVDMAVLKCYRGYGTDAPVVVLNGKPYGLTGAADIMYGQSDTSALNPFWRKSAYGLRVDLHAITQDALALCKKLL